MLAQRAVFDRLEGLAEAVELLEPSEPVAEWHRHEGQREVVQARYRSASATVATAVDQPVGGAIASAEAWACWLST
jgi:hypothetical protein